MQPDQKDQIELRNGEIRRRRSRFSATCLIPIDGVDFDPYLMLLLTQYKGQRLADRVVVITDEDPTAPGDRRSHIERLASDLGAGDLVSVHVGSPTLEGELFPGNAKVLEAAFRKCHPKTDRWPEVMSKNESEQPQALINLLSATKTRKGEFAQAVAELIQEGAAFTVPSYLRKAIYCISTGDEDTRAAIP